MKQNINEIKKMQRLAGLITESEYQESVVNEAKKDIPSILRKWDAAPGDRLDYQTVANMIEVGRIQAAAKFITNELDTSIREMMMDIIEENDPKLFDEMFGSKGTSKVSSSVSDMDDDNKLGFSSDVKAFIDDAVKSAKEDGDFEDLMDADYFEEDFIDYMLEEFDEEGEYDGVSQAVIDYIAKVTGSIKEDLESDLRGDLEKTSGMSSLDPTKVKILKALFKGDVSRSKLNTILKQLNFQSTDEFENAWEAAGLELDVAKPGEGYTVWSDNYENPGDYIEFINGKFNKVIRSGDE